MCKPEVWHPWNDLAVGGGSNSHEYAVLILNTPINLALHASVLLSLWNRASLRVTVDGGTNQWISWLSVNATNIDKVKPPDIVSGDMDSISKEVLHYYIKTNNVTNVIHTPDQNETDFTKALHELRKYITSQDIMVNNVYVIADTCGRFDQIMANINTLYKARNILPKTKVFILSQESLTWLIDEGSHAIDIPASVLKNDEWCALIPVGCPCQVSTKGLKWNLNKTVMEFGKLVSTSNKYNGDPVVHVQTDKPLVWSMGINNLWRT